MNELIHGDCLQHLEALPAKVNFVLTDPPYPDYHVDKYGYVDISFLLKFNCRQFVFWSSKAEFPLDYTAIHIWDKKTGAGSEYERIFERNGQRNYKVFRHYFINSTVAASFTQDVYTGHPSQKPVKLLAEILEYATQPNQTVFDPFMGSGSCGVACIETGRQFVGIEKNKKWFDIASKRVSQAKPALFTMAASNTASSRLFEGWGDLPAVANQSEGDSPA